MAAAPAEARGVENLPVTPLALVRGALVLGWDVEPAANRRRPGIVLDRLGQRLRAAHGDRRVEHRADVCFGGRRPRRCRIDVGHAVAVDCSYSSVSRLGEAGAPAGIAAHDTLEP